MSKTKKVIKIMLEIILSLVMLAVALFFVGLLYAFCLAPTGLFGMPNDCSIEQKLYLLFRVIPLVYVALFRPLKSKQHYLISIICLGIFQFIILRTHGIVIATSGGIPEIDGIELGIVAVVTTVFYAITKFL